VIAVLEDGTYDAIVFDVDDTAGGDALIVELTVLAGPHKGEVVSLRASDWSGDALDLLGMPATLTVVAGEPTVRFEP
jgi:hypothetical protein